MKLRRPHPVMMLVFLRKYAYWLLLPVFRSAYMMLTQGISAWNKWAAADLIVLCALLWSAFLYWFNSGYALYESGVYYRSGLIFRRERFLAAKSIHAVCAKGSLPDRVFFLRLINPQTALGISCRRDIPVYLSKAESLRLMSVAKKDDWQRTIRFEGNRLLLFSLFSSNALVSTALGAALLFRGGKLLGSHILDQILDQMMAFSIQIKLSADQVASILHLAYRLPLLGAWIAAILIVGWIGGFLRKLESCYQWNLSVSSRQLYLSHGLFTKRRLLLSIDSVCCTQSRKTLLMFLFHRRTVFIQYKGSITTPKTVPAVLIPFSDDQEAERFYEASLPLFCTKNPDSPKVMPDRHGAVWGYLFAPAALFFASLGVSISLYLLGFPFSAFLQLICFSVILCSLWLFCIRICSFFTSSVFCSEKMLIIKTHCFLSLQEIRIPFHHILNVRLRQHLFQQEGGRCDLIFSVKTKGRLRFSVRNLPISHAIRLLNHIYALEVPL